MDFDLKQCRSYGFSLPEVSISIAIVAIALLPVIGILGVVSNGNKSIKDKQAVLNFVDNISQTLHQETRSPVQFIWRFPDSETPTVTINYPQIATDSTDVFFVGDERGRIVRSVTEAVYDTGDADAPVDELYLIKVTLRADDSSSVSQLVNGFSLMVDISIESPVTVSFESRVLEEFSSRVY